MSTILLKTLLPLSIWNKQPKFRLILTQDKSSLLNLKFTPVHLSLFVLSSGLTVLNYMATPEIKDRFRLWFLSNVFAISFSFNAISLLRLDGFRTGAILLGGLFVYDVWWVFGTEVMVSVGCESRGGLAEGYNQTGLKGFHHVGFG